MANARTQFVTICAGCHGSAGEGGIWVRRCSAKVREDVAQIAAVIRNPPPRMPKLTPVPVADADIPALARYVSTLGKP